jgi:hypothetical protein
MAYQPARAKYVPPNVRVNEPTVSISSDNFPEFGAIKSPSKPILNFKTHLLAVEEERKKANDPLLYDATQTQMIEREKLIKDGWAILPFSTDKVGFIGNISPFSKPIKYEIDLFMESLNLSTLNHVS